MWLLALAIGVGSFGLGMLAVKKALADRPGVQPNSRGLILGAVSGLAVMILYLVLKHYGQDIFKSETTAGQTFWAVLSLFMIFSIAWQIWQRRQGGDVLLDLGHPTRRLHLVMAGVVALPALMQVFTARPGSTWQALFYLTMAAMFVCQGLSALQIREGGIASAGGLLKWQKVKSFYWKKRDTVSITTTSKMPWSSNFDLQVPIEQVDTIEHLLTQHTSAQLQVLR